MKKLLLIIAMFMSPLTFAQLDGKGLICIPESNGVDDDPFLIRTFHFEGDLFMRGRIWIKNDSVRHEKQDAGGYSTSINTVDLNIWTSNANPSAYVLDRKTLVLTENHWERNSLSQSFTCSSFDDKAAFDYGIDEYIKVLQGAYDKKLEGNKI